ncbi:flavin reductase family protein [Nocardia takedensis]
MSDSIENEVTGCEAVVAAADYPVFVVTTRAGDELGGCLVGFTSQVSIDPVRFLVGLSKTNRTFAIAARASRLTVHLLGSEQKALAELFGGETGDDTDKFARCAWNPGPGEVPVLSEAAGWFSGAIIQRHDFGDHVGVVLAPDSGTARPSATRTLRMHAVQDLRPGHQA